MVDESPYTRLSETGQALHKVEPFTNGVVWVVVDTLLGRGLTKHVCQKSSMSSLLIGHELNEGHIFGSETGFEEFGL